MDTINNNASNVGNIVIEDTSHKKYAITALILAIPPVAIWLLAILWIVSRVGFFKYPIDVAGTLPSQLQAFVFIGFPIFTLASGSVAYKKSKNKLSLYSFILGLVLVVLSLVIVFK